MGYKFIDERICVDPKTGQRITAEEFHARGYSSGAKNTKINKAWEKREQAFVMIGGAHHIIKDIEPYIPVATNRSGGQRPIIGGRRQHRDFLRANGYVEVGNDYGKQKREELSQRERVNDIKQAMEKHNGN